VEASAAADTLFKASQNECEILRAQVLELRKNLQDAQDFIFSLQPRQQKLTETEAAEDFYTLCGSIEEWVDSKFGEALDGRILTKEKVLSEPLTKLLSLIPHPGKEAFKYPGTDEYNITAAILQFLCNEIFNKEFYCPIGDREIEFMVSVEKSMRNIEPRRG
jgi:GAF domain-containing protein